MLQLQMADNGKGFCAEAVGNGNGMKSMQARAGELNGQLEIEPAGAGDEGEAHDKLIIKMI